MAGFDYNALNATGMFPGVDAEQLRLLMEQLQPSEEDRKRARREGLMMAGFGLIANSRKGQEAQAFGNAGMLGMQTHAAELDRLGKERGQMITQAAGLQKIGREAGRDTRFADVLRGLFPGQPGPQGGPPPGIGPPPLAPPPIGPIGMKPPPPEMPEQLGGPVDEMPPGPPGPQMGGVPPPAPVAGPPPGMVAPGAGMPPGTPPAAQAQAGPGLPGLMPPVAPAKMLALLGSDHPAAPKVAEWLEKDRKIEFSRDGVLTQGGRLVGKEENGRWLVYPDGDPSKAYALPAPPGWVAQKVDEARQMAAAQEGEKRVQVQAMVNGKPQMIWVRQADLGAQGQPPGAPPGDPNRRVSVNLKDASVADAQKVLTELVGGAPGAVGEVGVSPTPLQSEEAKGQYGVKEHGQKALIDHGVKRLGAYTERADKMTPLISIVDDLQAREDQFGGVYGGAGANVKLKVAQWANGTFGLKKDLSSATGQSEAYDAGISELKQAIARSFPGSQSDAELKALSDSLPERILTVEGRAYIRDTIRRKTEHAINVRKAAEEYFYKDQTMMGFVEPKAPPPPVLWKPIEKFKLKKDASELARKAYQQARAAKSERLMAELVAGGDVE